MAQQTERQQSDVDVKEWAARQAQERIDTLNGVSVDIGGTTLIADARTFSSGSRGFYASGKVVIGGKKYQCSVNVVEIGSKPGSAAESKVQPVASKPAKNGALA